MKKPFYLITIFALFFLMACGGSSNKPTEENEAAIKKEVQKLDSLSQDMDSVSSEIDKNTEALEDALKALEQE